MMQVMTSGAANSAPMLIGVLLEASLVQTTPFYGMRNILRVSFSSNVWLPASTVLFISGFSNTSSLISDTSQNRSLPTVVASGDSGGGVGWIEQEVSWDVRAGLLLATLTSELEANRHYSFGIQLLNPQFLRQSVRRSQLWAAGAVLLRPRNVSLAQGNFAPLFTTGMCVPLHSMHFLCRALRGTFFTNKIDNCTCFSSVEDLGCSPGNF